MSSIDFIVLFIYIMFETIVSCGIIYFCLRCVKPKRISTSSAIVCGSILFSLILMSKSVAIFLSNGVFVDMAITLFICPIILKFVYDIDIPKLVISICINSLIFLWSRILYLLILNILTLDAIQIISNFIYYVFSGFITSILKIILAVIFAIIYNKFVSPLPNLSGKLKNLCPQGLAIFICLILSFVIMLSTKLHNPIIIFTVNVVQLVIVSSISIFSARKTLIHEQTKEDLSNALIYNSVLQKNNERVRGFKHDMSNIVQAISGYIELKDFEGAKSYCQNLLVGFKDINLLSILSPHIIDEPGTYGVVATKILLAREKSLDINIDITTSVKEINFPFFELSRTIGVLLDNAIEAAEKTNTKKLTFEICFDENKHQHKIIVSNSVENINFDIDKIFEKNYSTKTDPSGFGLYEISRFLDSNPQAVIYPSLDIDKQIFTQTMIINKR